MINRSAIGHHTANTLAAPSLGRLQKGFWIIVIVLLAHAVLVVLPSYFSGIELAYQRGWRIKDMHFAVPGYTPYSLRMNLMLLIGLVLIVLSTWVLPFISAWWLVRLAQRWRDVPVLRKSAWLVILALLWGITLATKSASDAFYLWIMD